jgi:hypothetical protein
VWLVFKSDQGFAMPRLSIIAVVSALALGACQAGGEPAEPVASQSPALAAAPSQLAETASPAGSSDAAGDECGADKVAARWLNALPTDEVKADIAARVGDRPIRYYSQGDPITMDFNAARLNVESGPDGRIKLFRCG